MSIILWILDILIEKEEIKGNNPTDLLLILYLKQLQRQILRCIER